MKPVIQNIADACERTVNSMRSPSPRDMAEACVAALAGYALRDDLGDDDVRELRDLRMELAAAALENVLFGDAHSLDEWTAAEEARQRALLSWATPAGRPHGTIGTWAAGRSGSGSETP